jgi:hypothetical protein
MRRYVQNTSFDDIRGQKATGHGQIHQDPQKDNLHILKKCFIAVFRIIPVKIRK